MKEASATGHMLALHDSMEDDWPYLTTANIVDMALKFGNRYDLVVSHDKNGEYGHIQHKRVHIVAKRLASKIGSRFSGFKARYNRAKLNVEKRDKILYSIYKSQKKVIDWLKDYCEINYSDKRKTRKIIRI